MLFKKQSILLHLKNDTNLLIVSNIQVTSKFLHFFLVYYTKEQTQSVHCGQVMILEWQRWPLTSFLCSDLGLTQEFKRQCCQIDV